MRPLEQRNALAFPTLLFSDISAEARDFIRALLQVDPTKRLSAAEALIHPWLVDSAPASAPPVVGAVSEPLVTLNFSSTGTAAPVARLSRALANTTATASAAPRLNATLAEDVALAQALAPNAGSVPTLLSEGGTTPSELWFWLALSAGPCAAWIEHTLFQRLLPKAEATVVEARA